MKTCTRFLAWGIAASMLIGTSCNRSNNADYRIISVEEYTDKMMAGWLGQMIGVGWAGPTEFQFVDVIIPENKMPAWDPEMINCFGQDDLYVEMTFLATMEKHGIDASIRQAGIDFANTRYFLWGANDIARANLQLGIAPPDCSHPKFNSGADWIDYQIEADFSGLIAPGMPNAVIELGEKFGRLMNYGDGLYAGQFVGGMYASAFFEKDITRIIEAGLACIPPESQYAGCVRDVMKWHKENPTSWESTWKLIKEKYHGDPEYQKYKQVEESYWTAMDAKLNGAMIILGMLYGNGNLDSTIIISTRAGYDSDCNPSSAAGVLLTSLGQSAIDTKFTSALRYDQVFDYTTYDLNGLKKVCLDLAKQLVLKNGGEIKTIKGKEHFVIPMQVATPSEFVQSWEPGPIAGVPGYTEEELAQIHFRSNKHYKPLVKELWPSVPMQVDFCTKASYPEPIAWKGREKVLTTSAIEDGSCVLHFSAEIKSDKSLLTFSVSHDEKQSWNLKIRANWNEVILEETIDSSTCPGGWKDYKIDLSKYKGTHLTLHIFQSAPSGTPALAYWHGFNLTN